MDSGLARFAVLIVLFFILTGDLAGLVRQLYEESSGYGGSKQKQQTPVPSKGNGARVVMADKGSVAMAGGTASTSKSIPESDSAEGEGTDPDIEAFGKQSCIMIRDNRIRYPYHAINALRVYDTKI